MKKIYLIAAACLVLCFIFAGCDMRFDRAVDDVGNAAGDAVRDVGDAANKAGEMAGDAVKKTGDAVGDTVRKAGDIANDATGYHYDANANNIGLKGTNAGTYSAIGKNRDLGRSVIESIGNNQTRTNGDGTSTSISSYDDTRAKIVDYYRIGRALGSMSNSLYGNYSGRVTGVNDTSYYSRGAMAGGLMVPRGY